MPLLATEEPSNGTSYFILTKNTLASQSIFLTLLCFVNKFREARFFASRGVLFDKLCFYRLVDCFVRFREHVLNRFFVLRGKGGLCFFYDFFHRLLAAIIEDHFALRASDGALC